MSHENEVHKIVSASNAHGYLKSRENNTVEFKQSFNLGSAGVYAKTMAAFANNRGGYIIFGVKDNPREVVGLKGNNFESLNQEKLTGAWIIQTIRIPRASPLRRPSINMSVRDTRTEFSTTHPAPPHTIAEHFPFNATRNWKQNQKEFAYPTKSCKH